jgi:hypothetical protein
MRHLPALTLRRLVCTCYRQRPAAVVLAETSYNSGEGSRAGADPGWKVDLLQILRNAGRT